MTICVGGCFLPSSGQRIETSILVKPRSRKDGPRFTGFTRSGTSWIRIDEHHVTQSLSLASIFRCSTIREIRRSASQKWSTIEAQTVWIAAGSTVPLSASESE